MKNVMKKFLARVLTLVMIVSMFSGTSFTAFAADESASGDYASCIALGSGVPGTTEASTYIYNGYKPDLGTKFTDESSHKMTYYESRSVYDEESQTWGEASSYEEIQVGFASSLAEYAVTESEPGTYSYSWKAYCEETKKLSEATYTVTLNVNDPSQTYYEMTFYVGRDNLGAEKNPLIKLYPTTGADSKTGYDTFDEAEEITLEGGELDASNQYRVYTARLKGGYYSYRAYGYDEETDEYTRNLGGMSVKVPMASNVTQSGYDESSVYIRCTTVASKTKYDGTNYLSASQYHTEVVCPYYNCTATPGESYQDSNGVTLYPYMLIAQGNACLYNYFSHPDETVADEYNLMFSCSINATIQKNYTVQAWTSSVANRITSAITVQKGVTPQIYFQMNNFRDMEIQPYEKIENEDDTVTWKFYCPKNNGNYTWRASKDGYMTKAGYMSLGSEESASFSVTLDSTETKTHDESGLASTVATRDEANLIMNVNDRNTLDLTVGDTFRVRSYRVWEIINGDAGNIMIEPDFHYEVLSGSDCVEVEKVEDNRTNGNGNWLDVKGLKNGTAVIAVTYDAIDVDNDSRGGVFPAIDPQRTGIVVVNVNDGTSDIKDLGVRNTSGNNWSWNYDTVFFEKGSDGILNVSPRAASGIDKVEVASVTTTDDLKSTLGAWKTAAIAEGTETYDVPVVSGNNIIKITSKNGSVGYQVVRATEFTAEYENLTNPGEDIMPGDQVKVTFEGLYRSVPKISGIFNPVTLQIAGNGSDGTSYAGNISQYQQADSGSLTVTIPKDLAFEEGSKTSAYVLSDLYIYLSFMYSYADAWQFMYTMTDAGTGTCFNAVGNTGKHCTFSDLTIPVSEKVTYDVSFDVKDEENNAVSDYNLEVTDAQGNVVTDYSALGYGTYEYKIQKAGYVVTVGTFSLGSKTENDNGKTTVAIKISKVKDNAWDGTTMTQPVMEGDTYLIRTGAELAWFANAVNTSEVKSTSTLNAKLETDIDLAGYNWPKIGYYTSSSAYVYYGGTFDGGNHVVYNFCIEDSKETTTAYYDGFFSYLSGADVKDLMIKGRVSASSTKNIASAYVGGLAGYVKGGTYTNLSADIDVTVKRTGGNNQYVAGVFGYVSGAESISNIKNQGNVSGYNYVGGAAGFTDTAIAGAVNEGDVYGNQYTAGIAAAYASVDTMEHAYNKGNVKASGNYAAGIVGTMTKAGTLAGALNDGTIEANGYAGGVIGGCSAAAVVTDCVNLGDITAAASTGGVAGYTYSAAATFQNCSSYGKITADKSTTGDLVGTSTSGKFVNCTVLENYGKLFGSSNAAVVIDNCAFYDSAEKVLYAAAKGKDFASFSEAVQQEITEKVRPYTALLMNKEETAANRMGAAEKLKADTELIKIELQNTTEEVYTAVQSGSDFLYIPKNLEVNAYQAERYGYKDEVTDGVSTLDVIVAAHEELYKDAFTAETTENYLIVSDTGTVEKAFQKATTAFGFAVDGSCPHDNTLIESAYGNYYTGYMINQAKVSAQSQVEFFFYQDEYYLDSYSWFTNGSEVSVKRGEVLPVTLKGYYYAFYGCSEQSVIESQTTAKANAQLAVAEEKDGKVVLTPLEGIVTNDSGAAELKFMKEGSYIVTAYNADADDPAMFMPVMRVTVEKNEALDNQEEADPVIAYINSIGEITLEKKTQIEAARSMYNALSDAEKACVSNIAVLEAAEKAYTDLEAVSNVETQIANIGEVTEEKEAVISAARAAYNALSDEQKVCVKNLSVLEQAETVLKNNKNAAAAVDAFIENIGTVTLGQTTKIAAARSAYDALTDTQKTYVTKLDILKAAEETLADLMSADRVTKLINQIGEVTLESKEAVDAAKLAYNLLNEKQKELVENVDVLNTAIKSYDKLAGEHADELIAAIGDVSLESKDKIEAARAAYNALSDQAKAENVQNYVMLEAAEQTYADAAAAAAVDQMIESLGKITLESKPAVQAAKDAYDALTDTQKAYVKGKEALDNAQKELAEKQKEAFEKLSITLEKTTYTYTGKALKPGVVVKDQDTLLAVGREYTISYQNNINAGTGTVTVTGNGDYAGTKTLTFQIQPASQTITGVKTAYTKLAGAKAFTLKAQAMAKVTYTSSNTSVAAVNKTSGKVTIKGIGKATITITAAGDNYKTVTKKVVITVNPKTQKITSLKSTAKKSLTVKWTKHAGVTGYQIMYSTSSSFKNAKKVNVTGASKNTKKISGLKSDKKYYVKVRSYKKVGGKTYYGSYSKTKKAAIK